MYVRGEENPDPQATTKENRELFFTGVTDMVIKTRYTNPRWEAAKIKINIIQVLREGVP